jgi:predicted NBD/HSP70 family sugar kinase
VTASAVAAAAEGGDPEALELLARSGERLGEALAVLVDLLHLERIVL